MDRKRIRIISAIFWAVLILGNTVCASEGEKNQKGIIVIQNDDMQETTSKFLCDKIADLENGSYLMRPGYTDREINLNCDYTAEELKEISESIDPREKSTTIIKYPNSKGEVRFEHLDEGIYFVRKEEKNGKTMIPVLVSLPMWDENKQDMRYEATIVPKYAEKNFLEQKQSVKTGDAKEEFEHAMILLIMSCTAVVTTKIFLNILQKY